MESFDSFLTDRGKGIYQDICEINRTRELTGDLDSMLAAMLANSIDLYWRMAEVCRRDGYTQKPAAGGWDQIRPEYTVMRTEFSSIMKHMDKFGISPKERAEIMKQRKGPFKFDTSTPLRPVGPRLNGNEN